MEKVKIIEFCILELVYVPNFRLNWQFWCIEPNFRKEGISNQKRLWVYTWSLLTTLSEEKHVGKKWRIFLPVTNFFADYFFYWQDFMPTFNSTDEYSYRHFFYKRVFVFYKHLVFSNWKIPLVYLFDFKFD